MASSNRARSPASTPASACSRITPASASLAAASVTRDDLLKLLAAGVEPSTVQHRRHRQRRRRRVVDDVPSAAVQAVPAPARGRPCRRRGSRAARSRAAASAVASACGKIAVFVIAQPAAGALGVDHDRDRGVGPAAAATSAMWPTEPNSSGERSTRITQPNSPRSMVTRTRDFSGTKPRTAGSAAISAPGRLSWKSDCDVVMPRRWLPAPTG